VTMVIAIRSVFSMRTHLPWDWMPLL